MLALPKDQQLTAVIADRLVKLRRMAGLTQDNIADAVGIGRTNYSHYEKAKACPPPYMLARLASIFNVSVDFLLARESAPISALHDNAFPGFEELEQTLSRLNNDELTLVLQFRQLSPKQKQELFRLSTALLNEEPLDKEDK